MRNIAVVFAVGALGVVMLAAAADAQTPSPYLTTVVSDQVNVRAGPGAWWYVTGKLKKGDRVTVVGGQFGWAEIRPPAGQFSLIRKSDVTVDGAIGEVKGDSPVQARAGAYGEKRVNRVQVLLPSGSKVAILGSWGPYYQIAPPDGATVFVAASYLAEPGSAAASAGGPESADRPVSPVAPGPRRTGPTPATTPSPAARAPGTTQPDVDAVARAKFFELKATVEKYRKLLNDEMGKPEASRDYAGTLVKFQALKARAESDENEGLRQYAIAVIDYLNRQEAIRKLAPASAAGSEAQRIFEEAQRIASTPTTRPQEPLYQVTGVLRTSSAFTNSTALPDFYKLMSASGDKVLCYLKPAEPTADWSAMLGRSVRVAGTRQYRADWNTYVVTAEQIQPVGTVIEPPAVPVPAVPVPAVPVPAGPPQPNEDLIFGPRFEGPPGETPAPGATTQPELTPKAGGVSAPGKATVAPEGSPAVPVPELVPAP